MRKHGWIRRNKLKYQDHISNVASAVTDLQAVGFLNTKLTDLDEAANLLSRDELKDILKERHITASVDKPVSSFGLICTTFLFTYFI